MAELPRRLKTSHWGEREALQNRVLYSFALMVFAGACGTLGYWLLWRDAGGTVMDAAYMAFITMTTVGFHEVRPLGTAGRLLTMFVGVTGIGSLFYGLAAVMEYVVQTQASGERRRRRMQQRIAELADHVIVAGLGRVGRQAAQELAEQKQRFVTLDRSPEAEEFAAEHGFLHVRGDSTSDEALEEAGIARASGLIVTTGQDATNLYIVISARLKNPKLRIMSRATDDASVPKLLRAGADRAISPYAVGGRRLAHLMSNPNVVEFFETALTRGNSALSIVDIEVGAAAAGKRLGAVRTNEEQATVLAVLRGGTPLLNPGADYVLERGDRLLALGTDEQIGRLEAEAAPR